MRPSWARGSLLRLPDHAGEAEIDLALRRLLMTLGDGELTDKLWIVELDRVREYIDRHAIEE